MSVCLPVWFHENKISLYTFCLKFYTHPLCLFDWFLTFSNCEFLIKRLLCIYSSVSSVSIFIQIIFLINQYGKYDILLPNVGLSWHCRPGRLVSNILSILLKPQYMWPPSWEKARLVAVANSSMWLYALYEQRNSPVNASHMCTGWSLLVLTKLRKKNEWIKRMNEFNSIQFNNFI